MALNRNARNQQRDRQAIFLGYHRALRAGGRRHDPRNHEPIGAPHSAASEQERAAGITAGEHVPSCSGSRGHLPRLRCCVAYGQHRPCGPRPVESDERHRELPHGGARRACRALQDCAYTTIAYNSCRNRHCPKCQGAAAREWMAAREAELLPVPYFHVVFTLPSAIGDIAYQNNAVIYNLLFKVAAETMRTIAADPRSSAPASASPPCCTPGARP